MEYTIIYICLLVGGLIQLLCFFVLLYFSMRSKRWPKTEGKILSSRVSSLGWDDEDVSKSYKAIIRYKYEVQNKIYISDKLNYGDWLATSFLFYVKKIVKRYEEGCKCTVYYNPQKPQYSVLETALSISTYSLLVGGLLFFL